jgi:hypothetical protein
MFASTSLTEHLVRGAIGISLFALALYLIPSYPILAALIALAALVPFRGCPACWTFGLYETACKVKPKSKN